MCQPFERGTLVAQALTLDGCCAQEAAAHGKTLCHGDARTENCLWPNQRTEGIVIIDWQFISYGNPMTGECDKPPSYVACCSAV